LPVFIVNQSNIRRTIRVVLNRFHNACNTIDATLKIDDTVHLLMPTTSMMSRNLTMMISTTSLGRTPQKTLFRLIALKGQFFERTYRRVTSTSTGWLVFANSHNVSPQALDLVQ
jgi:hypothetical protein